MIDTDFTDKFHSKTTNDINRHEMLGRVMCVKVQIIIQHGVKIQNGNFSYIRCIFRYIVYSLCYMMSYINMYFCFNSFVRSFNLIDEFDLSHN
jgi:hypothetical protein